MLRIRLLGPPVVERDGSPVRPPRGRKAWALLAYLLLAERPMSRAHLAELFFGTAADPLGALRWTLAELRRALGLPFTFSGDPVTPALGLDAAVDVGMLVGGDVDGTLLLDLGGELLEGLQLEAHPEFESWLVVERYRLSALVETRLREMVFTLLADGRAIEARPYAAGAVACNPLEEGNHELLVRSLAMSGDHAGAVQQVAVCADILRRDLGVEVSAALRDAATVVPASAMVPPSSGRAAAGSQLDAGEAAILAGALDAGIQCLRRATTEAARCGDLALEGRALLALGSALVHAVRGRDEEGAVVLHQAITVATRAGDRPTAVRAHCELGFVEVQAGRRTTAEARLARAAALAETDEETAAVLGVRGMNASDRADYPTAFAHLAGSVDRARRCGDRRQEAWSLSLEGRARLLRGEHGQASAALTGSLDLVREERWIAFLPWPQALQAEVDLQAGRVEPAGEAFEQAWAMACQLGDPCWEGMAARGLGLVHAGRGDLALATGWLGTAIERSNRVTDRYRWVHAYVLEAAVDTAIARGAQDRAQHLVTALGELAARCEMRELVVRALLHRSRLGDRTALPAARLLGATIDNPALACTLEDPTRRSA